MLGGCQKFNRRAGGSIVNSHPCEWFNAGGRMPAIQPKTLLNLSRDMRCSVAIAEDKGFGVSIDGR
jgi:hypothetical protein